MIREQWPRWITHSVALAEIIRAEKTGSHPADTIERARRYVARFDPETGMERSA